MAQDWSVPFARLGHAALFICRIGHASPITGDMIARSLSAEEKRRVSDLRNPDDRSRVARCRTFLRAVLAAQQGIRPHDIRLAATARGKPYLAGPGPFFSCSRARDLAAIVLSETRAVGVDIEEAARLPQRATEFADLVAVACRPAEAKAVAEAPDPRATFLRFWTAKEARMKLTGEGLSLPLLDIAVSFGTTGHAHYALPQAPAADLTLVDDLLPDAAVAVASGPGEVHLLA
jgi:4'-phosphopantetheinyl transferase